MTGTASSSFGQQLFADFFSLVSLSQSNFSLTRQTPSNNHCRYQAAISLSDQSNQTRSTLTGFQKCLPCPVSPPPNHHHHHQPANGQGRCGDDAGSPHGYKKLKHHQGPSEQLEHSQPGLGWRDCKEGTQNYTVTV